MEHKIRNTRIRGKKKMVDKISRVHEGCENFSTFLYGPITTTIKYSKDYQQDLRLKILTLCSTETSQVFSKIFLPIFYVLAGLGYC